MKRAAWALAVACLFYGGTVSADTPPSPWERARDPEAAAAFDLHCLVERGLKRPEDGDVARVTQELALAQLERALAILVRAGAERSKSPLLRFDLGLAYLSLLDHPRAAQVLKSALAEFPDDPAAPRAWMNLAFACGHIGDHVCERDAYVTVLRLETEEIRRAVPTLNLAETRMHLGDIAGAIDGYREVIRLSGRVPTRETAPLATWGLAVALDRSGDRVGAEREARFAIELEHSMGLPNLLRDKQTVFFFPDYEVHWYEGLGAAAIAREATTARARAAWWREAVTSFTEYVRRGEPKNDPWLAVAKARLAQATRELEVAAKAAEREPRPPASKDVLL